MDPLPGTLVLLLLALVGARFSFSRRRVAGGPRLLLRTGIPFLVLGFVLGPAGAGLLTEPAMRQLVPFLALGLGWVGFHFGLQLDLGSLRRFPPAYHLLGAGQAVLTFALFLGGGWLLLGSAGLRGAVPFLLVMGAAATAAVSTPAGVAMISSNFLVRGNVRDLLLFTASLDAGIGILALEITYALYRPEVVATGGGVDPLLGLGLAGAAAGLGVLCGIVFLWLTRTRPATEELVLYLLGTCSFAAGAALQWGLSPLFVAVVMGALVANLDPDRSRIFALLERWEKPVYLTFLLLAGALLAVPTLWVVALALVYALLRGLAKTSATAILASVVPLGFPVPRRLGLGLLPQGGISLAMAVSGVLVYADLEMQGMDAGSLLFTVIVLGVMLSELTGPWLTVHVLRAAGEISPRVEEALARGDHRAAEREALRHTSAPDRVKTDPS